jgi:hypothetical protein
MAKPSATLCMTETDCVAEDAVSCEPVSALNSLLTGKLTGNFAESGPPPRFFESDQRTHSIVYSRIPCATEQGISKRVSGKIFQGIGNRRADIRHRSDRALKHARCVGRCLLMGGKADQGGRLPNVCL